MSLMDGQAIPMPSAVDTPFGEAAGAADPAGRLGALFDAHHQRVYVMARRLTRTVEDARDAVQETFLRAARSPQSIPRGAPNEEAWLVRILINICRDRWRHSHVRTRAVIKGYVRASEATSPEKGLLARAIVREALERLQPRRRAILILYELEGATIPAIARMLGVTPVTVRWHLSMGRREMAKVLGGPTT